MNRKFLSLFIVICLGAAFITGGTLEAQTPAIRLTYSTFFPPTHIQSKLAEAWCREVEKRTHGKIFVEYYPGQTFTESTAWNCYDDIVNGRADIGFSALAYTRRRFPVMSAVDLPLGYPDGKAATAVVNEVYKRFMPKGLMDTRVMYLHANGPGLIHTKDRPVKKLEDMKGLKLRGHGASAQVLSALGAMPVAMPMPEVYQGLQTGLIDGSIYPWEINQGWRLGEMTRYCTAAFNIAYTTSFFVVMNKDKWASIPADLQKIIGQINDEWSIKHGAAWDASDMEGLRFFLSQGGTVIGLDQNEALRWQSAAGPVIVDYVAEAKKRGVANAQEIVDFIRQALDKYGK
ncbi:MAG: TRAP transporter substrate-binding protein [Proteobacteria bacterium]|nr:TRAP transporter substrate-binding protein [Pseudomonadota bacterium]